MIKKSNPIIVEQLFNASFTEVWKAITEVDQMRQWFFENIPSFEPVVGFETQFSVSTGERSFLHQWKLTEVEQNKKIVYNWSYEEYEGEASVVFELFKNNNRTLLKLTNIGLETFPQNIPEFSRESYQQGWEYFIQNRLKEYLKE